MTACFADTFFFLALLNPSDLYHQQAHQLNEIDCRIFTSEWVLLELSDHLCQLRNRHLPNAVREALAEDSRFEIIPTDQLTLKRSIALYDKRRDKEWSLTDCTSFVLMADRRLNEALTGDHHFEQAGYQILMGKQS